MGPTAMLFYVAFLWQFYLSWEKQLYFVEGQQNSTLHPLGCEEAAPSPWSTLAATVGTQWDLATHLITSSDDLLWDWKQWEKASTEDYWHYCTLLIPVSENLGLDFLMSSSVNQHFIQAELLGMRDWGVSIVTVHKIGFLLVTHSYQCPSLLDTQCMKDQHPFLRISPSSAPILAYRELLDLKKKLMVIQ